MEHRRSPGATLRAARLDRGLGIEECSEATRIRPAHLRAIEEDRLDALPAPAYVAGFVRAYAAHLGIEAPEAPAPDAADGAVPAGERELRRIELGATRVTSRRRRRAGVLRILGVAVLAAAALAAVILAGVIDSPL